MGLHKSWPSVLPDFRYTPFFAYDDGTCSCLLTTDLAEKARGLESDVLLMLARKDTGNGEVVVDLERKRRATRQRPDSNGSWVKGFLSGGTLDKPTGRPSRGRDVLTVRYTLWGFSLLSRTCCESALLYITAFLDKTYGTGDT